MKKKILITTSSFNAQHQELRYLTDTLGYEIVYNPYKRRVTTKELRELICPSVKAMIAGTEILNEESLKNALSLSVVSRCGVGTDSVDKQFLKMKGIKLFTTPDAPTAAVAEHALALIFAASRNLIAHDKSVRDKHWKKFNSKSVQGKVLGIAGFGRIGRYLYKMLKGFDVEILIFDPFMEKCEGYNQAGSLKELASKSDILTLHMPLTEKNKHIIGKDIFDVMMSDAMIINTARGEIIDLDELEKFLVKNPAAMAALDVYDIEPYSGGLIDLPNTILTPHIASFTKEGRFLMEKESVSNLIRGLSDD